MPFILKTNPQDVVVGQEIEAEEKTMSNAVHIRVGDMVYIWFSGNQNDGGLKFMGTVLDCQPVLGNSNRRRIRCRLDAQATSPLSNADLHPWRDVRDNTPLSYLAKKLYRQAHNKICFVEDAAEDFLRRHFDNIVR